MKISWGKLTVALLGIAVFLSSSVAASTFGSGTFGSCQFGSCSIGIVSSSSVSLGIIPTVAGSCTVQKDIVTIETSASNGYTLTMSSNDETTALAGSASNVTATTATAAAPATLPMNKWGYRVDGSGAFGAGPTTATNNTSSIAGIYAGVAPLSSGGAVLKSTVTDATVPETTDVWYGVCVDTSIPSGIYTKEVLYTALTN